MPTEHAYSSSGNIRDPLACSSFFFFFFPFFLFFFCIVSITDISFSFVNEFSQIDFLSRHKITVINILFLFSVIFIMMILIFHFNWNANCFQQNIRFRSAIFLFKNRSKAVKSWHFKYFVIVLAEQLFRTQVFWFRSIGYKSYTQSKG